MKPSICGSAALVLLALPALLSAAEPLRDPTRPPSAPVQKQAPVPVSEAQVQLALQSVLVSDLRRRAMINDQLVQVGDRLAGMLVIDISSDGVVLESAERTVTLDLPRDRVKHMRGDAKTPARGRRNGP